MLAVRGIYDGEVVKLLEPVSIKKAEMIVTFSDTIFSLDFLNKLMYNKEERLVKVM